MRYTRSARSMTRSAWLIYHPTGWAVHSDTTTCQHSAQFFVVRAGFRGTLKLGMLGKTKSLPASLLTRRCVECGYDGSLLRNGFANQCARCGCDLRDRPARSYAEMEGFILSQSRFHPETVWPANEQRVVRRWMVFLFLCAALVGAIACLSFAAIESV